MRLPLDIVKLVTSYLPSKKLLPYFEALLETEDAKDYNQYFWANPHVFEAGIFSEAELPTAPKHVIAGNPACSNYILSNWEQFKTLTAVWRNPGLWINLKPLLKRDTDWRQLSRTIDWRELTKNPHPEAILYFQERGIPMDVTNPGRIVSELDFIFHCHGTISRPVWDSIWANLSAVPFLKQIVANQGKPSYVWLRSNPHPWAIGELCKSNYLANCGTYRLHVFQDLFQNEGIFETVDFSELQFLLSQVGV